MPISRTSIWAASARAFGAREPDSGVRNPDWLAAQFLGPERSIGCGLTWPDSLGQTHVDEHGQLSPALKEVFLPRRAELMMKILQACTTEGLVESVTDDNGFIETKSLDTRRTLGGSVTH